MAETEITFKRLNLIEGLPRRNPGASLPAIRPVTARSTVHPTRYEPRLRIAGVLSQQAHCVAAHGKTTTLFTAVAKGLQEKQISALGWIPK